jgi:hypothetical protein
MVNPLKSFSINVTRKNLNLEEKKIQTKKTIAI